MSRSMFQLIVAILTIATLLIVSFIFKIYEYPLWINEGGIIETLSVVGYFLCAVFILLKGGWSYIKQYYYFFILIILFGLRELDFDKRFTTMGIFKSKFYVSSSVPVTEKFMGLLAIAVLLYIIVSIVKNHSHGFFSKIKKLSSVHVGVLITFLTMVFSKSIDGIARKLGSLNIIMDEHTAECFEVVEEVLELGISLLILATLFIYFSKKV
jgi:hypothetical protein